MAESLAWSAAGPVVASEGARECRRAVGRSVSALSSAVALEGARESQWTVGQTSTALGLAVAFEGAREFRRADRNIRRMWEGGARCFGGRKR